MTGDYPSRRHMQDLGNSPSLYTPEIAYAGHFPFLVGWTGDYPMRVIPPQQAVDQKWSAPENPEASNRF